MITGKTIPFGLFGYPVKHTFSPQMHNAAFKKLNIDGVYIPFEVKPEDLEISLKSLKALGFGGINVTVPHKQTCMKYLDSIDEEAKLIGAVNTIKVTVHKLIGYNTDGKGFLNSLKEENIQLEDCNIFVLGAGGASRAITITMVKNVKLKKIYIYDIDSIKAQNLVDDLDNIVDNIAVKLEKKKIEEVMNKIDFLINATPVGLKKGEIPLKKELLDPKLKLVYDLIYNPLQTELLRIAQDRGINTINGLSMLVHQGAASFKIWTDVTPSLEVMREAVLSQIK